MENYKNRKLTYEDLKNIPIDNLGLSARSKNALIRNGIKNVAELIVLPNKELKRIRNMGAKSRQEVYEAIESLGHEEITNNMNGLDAFTIGISDEEKQKYINDHLDIVLRLKPNDIGISPYVTKELKRMGINSILDLVLSNDERLKKGLYYYIDEIQNALANFNLHLGMTKSEVDELVPTAKEEVNFTYDLHHIDDVNELLQKRNREQQYENDFYEIKLTVLKMLDITHSDLKELSDSEKAKIFETIRLIKEGRQLKETGEKLNKEIDELIKKLEKSSYVMEEKVKVKRKKDEDH